MKRIIIVTNSVSEVNVALLGLGVVGTGVAKVLIQDSNYLQSVYGKPFILKHILVNDLNKERDSFIPQDIITNSLEDVLNDDNINTVIEVIGGTGTAYTAVKSALQNGTSVVTANKELIAKFGPELRTIAQSSGAQLLYEASTAAAIPVISSLRTQLSGNKIKSIRGIINGTSNYIVSQMASSNAKFQDALREAQDLGYAESDPANDIEGTDALYKICILATLAFGVDIKPEDVYKEGITQLEPQDFSMAAELGYAIKHLGICEVSDDQLMIRVHPSLIPTSEMLSKVDQVYNAIEIDGNLSGKIVLHGQGAGQDATTSAIIGDLLSIKANNESTASRSTNGPALKDIKSLITKYYIRISVTNEPGVLAKISTILGELNISIASVIQKDGTQSTEVAELIITTYRASEEDLQNALKQIKMLPVVRTINTILRIED
ncbi:MAG: homoserine dehydrogenase [Candidatus Marinimicrobia bacterium]|nr:homoserine dehydrogenase [Candidatus Neomarinimicrobiota bacterium]